MNEEFEEWHWDKFDQPIDSNRLKKIGYSLAELNDCWNNQQSKIDAQAEELKALRGFAKAIEFDLKFESLGVYPKSLLKIYHLIDEDGNPTKLLTG